MSYLIAGYIFVGVCYVKAGWIAMKEDPKNKDLVASLKKDGLFVKAAAALVAICFAAIWPFLLLTLLFVLLIRHAATTNPGGHE